MLRSLDPMLNLIKNEQSTKCGEIFCQKENIFCIVCTCCSMKSFEFVDFVAHFQNVHWPSVKDKSVKQNNGDDNASREGLPSNNYRDPPSPIWETADERDYENSNVDGDTPQILQGKRKQQLPDPVECEKCDKQFKNILILKKHQERYCKQLRPEEYKCVRCQSRFDEWEDLKAHYFSDYGGFPCEQCHKVYKSKWSVTRHAIAHSAKPEVTPKFTCTYENCKKEFTLLSSLQHHKLFVHLNERKYVCEICGYGATSICNLADHLRTHTGERPYECSTCGKKYKSSSSLAMHKQTHSTEKPHVCDVCGKAFSLRNGLYHHKFLHSNTKQFVCKICGKSFAQMAPLSAHTKRHNIKDVRPARTRILPKVQSMRVK